MTRVFLGIFIPTLTVINSRKGGTIVSFRVSYRFARFVGFQRPFLFFLFLFFFSPSRSSLVHPAYVPIKSFARLGHAIPRFRSLSSQFSLSLFFFVTVARTVTVDELVQFASRSNRIFSVRPDFWRLNTAHHPFIPFSCNDSRDFVWTLIFLFFFFYTKDLSKYRV